MKDDTIYRKAAIDALNEVSEHYTEKGREWHPHVNFMIQAVQELPSAQPTLYGYNIEHLELIAKVLQKENLPPERVVEALTDIGRIVAIVRDEYKEALRKAVAETGGEQDG